MFFMFLPEFIQLLWQKMQSNGKVKPSNNIDFYSFPKGIHRAFSALSVMDWSLVMQDS